jgi:hypothetical protein
MVESKKLLDEIKESGLDIKTLVHYTVVGPDGKNLFYLQTVGEGKNVIGASPANWEGWRSNSEEYDTIKKIFEENNVHVH